MRTCVCLCVCTCLSAYLHFFENTKCVTASTGMCGGLPKAHMWVSPRDVFLLAGGTPHEMQGRTWLLAACLCSVLPVSSSRTRALHQSKPDPCAYGYSTLE